MGLLVGLLLGLIVGLSGPFVSGTLVAVGVEVGALVDGDMVAVGI